MCRRYYHIYIRKSSAVVAEKINHGLKTLDNFFDHNSLVNYKKSKTEVLLFDSHQKLPKITTIDITMNGKKISDQKTANI